MQYLFNAPEGFSRLALEHKLRPSARLQAVCALRLRALVRLGADHYDSQCQPAGRCTENVDMLKLSSTALHCRAALQALSCACGRTAMGSCRCAGPMVGIPLRWLDRGIQCL